MRVIAIGNWFSYMLVVLLGTSQAFEQFKITHSNKCSSTETYFRILYEMSLKECVFECDIRPKCEAVNYRHRRQQCELLQTDNPHSFEPTTEQTGPCVYIKKKHIAMNSSACCDYNCTNGTACNTNTGNCDIKECPRFFLPNGTIWGNMYRVGSRLKTQCDTGFKEPENDIYTTCNTSGHWDPDIQCAVVKNVCVTTDNTCTPTATCQSDGHWSITIAPTCSIVDCGPPPDAHVYGTKVETGTTFGASVTYHCNTTYTPNTTTTATCKADGNWNITSAPKCSPAHCQIRTYLSIEGLHQIPMGTGIYSHNTSTNGYSDKCTYKTGAGVIVADKTFVIFSVKSNGEVHIALSSTNSTDIEEYEIVLGGWSGKSSAIRKKIEKKNRNKKGCGDNMVFKNVNPLTDNVEVVLWISWEDWVIAVGEGSKVGCSAIMEWRDPQQTNQVNYIVVASKTEAAWKFLTNL